MVEAMKSSVELGLDDVNRTLIGEVIGKLEDMKKMNGADGKPRKYCFSIMKAGLPGMAIEAYIGALGDLRDEKNADNLEKYELAFKVLAVFERNPEIFASELVNASQPEEGAVYVLGAVPSKRHGASLELLDASQTTGAAVKGEVAAAVNWPAKSSKVDDLFEKIRAALEELGFGW